MVITAQHCTTQQKQENSWAATKASSTDVEKGASALRIGAVYCDRLSPCVQADVAAMATNPPTMKGKAARQAIGVYSRFFADFDAEKAASMVDFFDLPTNRPLSEMSKGMGEKLQISLVMSRRARVFLLDEPISGVDPATRDVILEGILREFDPQSLLIVSTHLISDIEHFVDYALVVKEGRILLQGDADDLRAAHADSLDAIFRKEYR